MSDASVQPEALNFDPEALRRKYAAERDKRMRPDGNQQYHEVAGDFSHYSDDPYCDETVDREPLTDEVDVIIIGGGFGGLITAARFTELGINDIRLIEKGSDFGGTWYWNRYPGAACDTESYIYLPLLEELNFIPTSSAGLLHWSRALVGIWSATMGCWRRMRVCVRRSCQQGRLRRNNVAASLKAKGNPHN